MGDQPIITVLIAVLFLVGLLYKGWVIEIRNWISEKVSS